MATELKPLKLSEVKNDIFEVEFDGQTRTYDPFKLAAALGDVGVSQVAGNAAALDQIRQAFGFPTEKEAAKSKSKTPGARQCVVLLGALYDAIEALPETKKLSPPIPS